MRNTTMRNTFKYITAILAVALLSGSVMTSWAQKSYTDEQKAHIKTQKQVIDNGDGTFTLKLETFVTGDSSNVFQKTSTSKPMDIVLVLDVSGSMKDAISSNDTTARDSQSYTYNGYGSSQYYYKHSNGYYYPVSRTTGTTSPTYTARASQNYTYSSYGSNAYYFKHGDGNYYQVDRKQGNKVESYNALNSNGYSYNGYGSNAYYYKLGDNYYQVSREITYAYTAQSSNTYSYDSYGYSTLYYRHTDGNYYQVTRERTGSRGNRSYNLHVTIDNKTQYLSGTGLSTSNPNVSGSGTTIWTGVLYNRSSNQYNCLTFVADGTKYYLYGTNTSPTTEVKGVTTNGTNNRNTTIWTGVLYQYTTDYEYYLSYLANGTTYYLTSNGSSSSRTVVVGNTTNIYTGVLYERSTTQYQLTYKVGTTTYYLDGTSATTTPSGKNVANDNIYTGVLYSVSTTSKSKIAILQDAVCSFIDSVAAKSDASNPHKVAIVKFASDKTTSVGNEFNSSGYNYSQIVRKLTDATNTTKATIKDDITSLSQGGATHADYGMQHAETIFSSVDTTKRKALVIMFTDGVPTDHSDWNNTVANGAISASKNLKSKGVIVYTVGTFSSSSAGNVDNYMNYVSSNYPTASSMSNAGTKTGSGYYILANNASAINAAFNTITQDIPAGNGGGEGIPLDVEGESAVHLADIVTSSFKVPQGENSVELKMRRLTGIEDLQNHATDTSYYRWGEEIDVPSTVKVEVTENAADTTCTIDISGFDFSANWVGPIYKKEIVGRDTTINYTESTVKLGAKLVIYVTIAPNPDAVGGLVPTNSDASGVYVGGVQITGDKIRDYITPNPVFTPMDLTIQIDGLGVNENAIFNVKGGNLGEKGMDIILTSTTDGSTASATIAKVPLNDASGNPITYTVTLDEKWIWAYTPANATDAPTGDQTYETAYTVKEHALYSANKASDGTITDYVTNHIFKFKVNPKENVSGHGENFKNNEFKIMPKTTATTN